MNESEIRRLLGLHGKIEVNLVVDGHSYLSTLGILHLHLV